MNRINPVVINSNAVVLNPFPWIRKGIAHKIPTAIRNVPTGRNIRKGLNNIMILKIWMIVSSAVMVVTELLPSFRGAISMGISVTKCLFCKKIKVIISEKAMLSGQTGRYF